MRALTLDTGALIAIERSRQRMLVLWKTARADRMPLIAPAACVAEWWRGRTDLREEILGSMTVVHTDDALVKIAGEALARVPHATCVDALVMATAARHGSDVFTSDVDDLTRLQRYFPSVRVLGV